MNLLVLSGLVLVCAVAERKSTLLEQVQKHSYGKALLELVGDSDSLALLNKVSNNIREDFYRTEDRYTQLESLCNSYTQAHELELKQYQEQIQKVDKELEKLEGLIEDSKTYVPEKEQEVIQAKGWSDTAKEEAHKQQVRFSEKEANLQKTLQVCEEATQVLEAQNSNFAGTAKSSANLLELSKVIEEPGDISYLVKALLETASTQIILSDQTLRTQIAALLNQLKLETLQAYDELKLSNQEAIQASQNYSAVKQDTSNNLARQLNVILDNQNMIQEQYYYQQTLRENLQTALNESKHQIELLENWCFAVNEKLLQTKKTKKEEMGVVVALKELLN